MLYGVEVPMRALLLLLFKHNDGLLLVEDGDTLGEKCKSSAMAGYVDTPLTWSLSPVNTVFSVAGMTTTDAEAVGPYYKHCTTAIYPDGYKESPPSLESPYRTS